MYRATLAILGLLVAGSSRADEQLDARLRKILIETPDTMAAWKTDLRARQAAVNRADREAWQAIHTKEDWERFKGPRIDALRASLGKDQGRLQKPRSTTTKTIKGDGFQVANLIYETRPGFFVTANLYSPGKPSAKMPGILICTSHHNPKSQGELQDMGMTWARQGCLVLVPDQIGHGERRNHPFVDTKSYPRSFKPGRQDYYFRYNEALQLHLIGESLMGWMVWDLMRGVDMLRAQQGVDEKAIILLGSVAGGGDPAAVTAALDQRVSAVAPFNFGGPQPETTYPLPANSEISFNYLGGGSWESTRNLRLSGKHGFLPWVIVGSTAPRGLVYGHEFAWDRDRDPVWARLRKLYGFYDAVDHLSSVHGRGAVTGRPPEATHCNNIGPEHRSQMYPILKRWFGIAEPAAEARNRLPEADLICWTPEVKQAFAPRGLWEVAGEIGRQRVASANHVYASQARKGPLTRREDWQKLLGSVEPGPAAIYHTRRLVQPLPVEVGLRGDGLGSYCLIPPVNHRKGQKYPIVVAFTQGGIQALLSQRAETVAALLQEGIGLCFAEMRGMGPARDRGRTSSATSLSATELMLGETVLGHQLRELRELLAHLRKHADVDAPRLVLWGESLTTVNPPDRDLAVPLDADSQPALAEPGCCLLALLGGLFEKDVRAICGRGGLASYQSLLRSPFVYAPHDAVVPGMLLVGDVTDTAADLAPRSVRLEGLVDGLNRRVFKADLENLFPAARRQSTGLIVTADISSPAALARWFAKELIK
jgi:dienelactone hydrolase